MISCTLRGRMGNQMFIIATTIAHALRMNTNYAIPQRSGKRDQFSMMFDQLNGELEIEYQLLIPQIYQEERFGIYNSIPLQDSLHLKGYFQCEKYFKDYRNEVIAAFNIPRYPIEKNTVAIHVRRGDYLRLSHKHNVLTKYWIELAMYNMAIKLYPKKLTFCFFSDDLPWCIKNFRQCDNVLFYANVDSKETMGRIAACEHGIMSASSFSWWGNWIAENNVEGDRIVIAPKNWFNSDYKRLQSRDIVPQNWIRL